MKLELFTIVLNGMPQITWHLPMLNRLQIDWHWTIAEGAAANTHCTSWCQPQQAMHSSDGTVEYLSEISKHPRLTVLSKSLWDGKVSMCNACLSKIQGPCILLQVDSDEIWTHQQLESMMVFFEAYPEINCARFFCRYFVGQNLITVGEDCYGNNPGEWLRAWRFAPGMKFLKHEPPVLENFREASATREQTRECDLVFDHYAYVFESQLCYKELFYGYKDALKHWRSLQDNTRWPAKLRDFLPWVDGRAMATPLSS